MAHFKKGDRVRARGVPETSDEYDVGTVVAFTFSEVKVYWERAAEVYTEDASNLESAP